MSTDDDYDYALALSLSYSDSINESKENPTSIDTVRGLERLDDFDNSSQLMQPQGIRGTVASPVTIFSSIPSNDLIYDYTSTPFSSNISMTAPSDERNRYTNNKPSFKIPMHIPKGDTPSLLNFEGGKAPNDDNQESIDLAYALTLADQDSVSYTSLPKSPDEHRRESHTEDADLALALSLSINEYAPSDSRPTPSDAHHSAPPTNSTATVKDDSSSTKKSNDDKITNIIGKITNFLNPPNISISGGGLYDNQICFGCKGKLHGYSYSTVGDNNFHPSCLKCKKCNERIVGNIIVQSDALYHPHCANRLPPCCVCCNPLQGRYFMHPFFSEEKYCGDHRNSPTCFSCGRRDPLPVTGRDGHVDLPDGRVSCMECMSTAVFDSSEAIPISKEIISFFETDLKLTIPPGMRDIPILAVDLPSLNENASNAYSRQHPTVRGLTMVRTGTIRHMTPGAIIWDQLQGGYKDVGSRDTYYVEEYREIPAILVLYGMPRVLFASVLAHELMHAWIKLTKSMPVDLQSKVEEGLCQVIARRYLDHYMRQRNELDSKKLSEFFVYEIETHNDPIYGDGFREAVASVETLSLEVVLDHVRETKELPKI